MNDTVHPSPSICQDRRYTGYPNRCSGLSWSGSHRHTYIADQGLDIHTIQYFHYVLRRKPNTQEKNKLNISVGHHN